MSGSHELIAMISSIIYFASTDPVYMIVSAIYLVFACLKIHGVRVENNELIGIYLRFRYVLFALHMIGFIIVSIYTGRNAIIALIVGGVYFILDIGLTVILHSIWVDMEKTAGLISLALKLA